MSDLYDQIQEAKAVIHERWPGQPRIGIILGTRTHHQSFELEDYADALNALTGRQVIGKVVVTIKPASSQDQPGLEPEKHTP